jgi:hypothetical protein
MLPATYILFLGGGLMTWEEIQQSFPHQWLLFEALKARTENGMRLLSDLTKVFTHGSIQLGRAFLNRASG